MESSDWIAIISVIVSVTAIAVALAAPLVQQWWLRPVLRVHYVDSAPYRRIGSPTQDGRITSEIWVRVRVSNHGKSAARGVQLKAVSVAGGPGVVGTSTDFDPVRLQWSGRTDVGSEQLRVGDEMLVDVVKVQQWHGPEAHMELVTPDALPKAQHNDFLIGTYEIGIVAYAENSAPMIGALNVSIPNQMIADVRVSWTPLR